ncbi:MAG: CCA tRNA nucleotidyltransferase [Pseudomonadota bacterium]
MTKQLPSAPWTSHPGLTLLTQVLGAPNIRWVGGAVRDTLLGSAVADVDCATKHEPARVIDLCSAAGIRTIPTGIDHGTVTAIFESENGGKPWPVEITTLRRDVATDGRRATIAFASEWREDAARRDFTINALYADPVTGEISDYFDGLEDLAARRVRFIGDARQRIAEDHLRILRYYRFQARFGADLDEEAESACADMAETLKGLSRERIADELTKLLSLPDPHETITRMHARGVWGVVLPETCSAHLAALARLIAAEAEAGIAPNPIRRLAALLPPSRDVAETCAARLRLSKAQRARLINAAERRNDDAANPRALAYTVGLDQARDRLLLLGASAATLDDWTAPQFGLKGRAIVARGIAAGPEVARILRAVEVRWVAEGFPDADRVETLLNEELSARL